MENPIKMDDLGGKPTILETSISCVSLYFEAVWTLQKKAIFFYSQPRVEERVPGWKMVDSIGCFQIVGKCNVCFYPKDPDMS